MIKPTIEEMKMAWREDSDDFELIRNEVYDTWRHGTENELIVKRLSDNTFWQVCYRDTANGDYNDLRDGDLGDDAISQVEPYEVVKIEYRNVK